MHVTQNQPDSLASAEMTTPADTLRGAAHYIAVHGWTQGDYYDPYDNGPFPATCATGAISMAAHGRRTDDIEALSLDYKSDYVRAVDHFADYLDRHTCDPHAPDDTTVLPFDYNDAPGRTADQVITALRDAADEWDYHHASEDDLETYADACIWNETHPTRDGFLARMRAR